MDHPCKKHGGSTTQTRWQEAGGEQEEDRQNLYVGAELVLPWLSPPDLASISCTCKALNVIAKSILTLRSSDASRGLEVCSPIPFHNALGSPPYSYFIYTPSSILGFPSQTPLGQPWGQQNSESADRRRLGSLRSSVLLPKPPDASSNIVGDGFGCACDGDCCEVINGRSHCPCAMPGPEFLDPFLDSGVMKECGEDCACGIQCGNRTTQRGVAVRLKIVRDSPKGWCLHADQFIGIREFVCEYAGELLSTEEARKRQQKYDELAAQTQCGFSPALLVVREHLPSGRACLRLNIDATRAGNVARFINHACDGGNLSTVLVRNSGSLLPRLCFFASRDIIKGEELAFSYGDVRLRPRGMPCYCGASCCLGALPSEHT